MSNYGLDLGQKNGKGAHKKAKLVIAFLCFAIVLGSASLFLLWRSLNYDFNNIFGTSEQNTAPVFETQPTTCAELSGTYIFGAGVTDDEKKTLLFSQLISVDLKEKTVRVVAVPVNAEVNEQNAKTLSDAALLGGTYFKNALSEISGEEILRYVLLTESDYKAVFRTLGDITVALSEDINYDTDNMFLELSKGENVLTPEKTYKYMMYLCNMKKGEEGEQGCAEITAAAFRAFFNSENFRSADSLFEELINYCKTDITIVDFTKAKPAIEYLVPQSSKLTVKAFVSKSVKEIPDEE